MLAPVRGGHEAEKSQRTPSREPGHSVTPRWGWGGSPWTGFAIWGGWVSPGEGATPGTRGMADTRRSGPVKVGTFPTGCGYDSKWDIHHCMNSTAKA